MIPLPSRLLVKERVGASIYVQVLCCDSLMFVCVTISRLVLLRGWYVKRLSELTIYSEIYLVISDCYYWEIYVADKKSCVRSSVGWSRIRYHSCVSSCLSCLVLYSCCWWLLWKESVGLAVASLVLTLWSFWGVQRGWHLHVFVLTTG
jgi:hypothetical protein